MPMRYADQDTVLAQLKVPATDTERIAQVVDLENGLADLFDDKVGRSFGGSATPESREVAAMPSPVLVIGNGIRSITSIEEGGTWEGASGWANGDVLTPGDWRVWAQENGVIYAIERFVNDWSGVVRITGVWADQTGGSIPYDVREALTTLTVKEYRRRTSSPSDQVGPDGMAVPTPSGWSDPTVNAAIEHHIVARLLL